MKKAVLVVLSVVLCMALALTGIFAYQYFSINEKDIPTPTLQAGEWEITPITCEWHVPIAGGLSKKTLTTEILTDQSHFMLYNTALPLHVSQGYSWHLSLFYEDNDTPIWEGTLAEWSGFLPSQNGSYTLIAQASIEASSHSHPYGHFTFNIPIMLQASTLLEHSPLSVRQGDVVALRLSFLESDVVPMAESDLGLSIFSPTEKKGQWIAFVPVSSSREPDSYDINISAGDESWQLTADVVNVDFGTQDLIIDLTDPVITEANSAEAYAQYRATIPPLWQTYDEERYWRGTSFTTPSEGPLSTTFALTRTTNGTSPSSHPAIDIAAAADTPVLAPAGGRVVLAEYLLNTGYTLVIEHGGGLKAYFFHLNEIYVKKDDIVQRGDLVGLVGSTGYSTGPHLHYEVRIGSQPINPSWLLDGSSNLFYFEKQTSLL